MPFLITNGVTSASSTGQIVAAETLLPNPFQLANYAARTVIVNTTAEDWAGFHLNCHLDSNLVRALVVVGVGADGFEEEIAMVPARPQSRNNQGWKPYIPVPVPAGSRVVVAVAANAAVNAHVQILGVPASAYLGVPAFKQIISGPYDLEASSGSYLKPLEISAPGIANTEGAFTAVTITGGLNSGNNLIDGGSLPADLKLLGVAFSEFINAAQTAQNRLIDMAYGASFENPLITDLMQYISGSEVSYPNDIIWGPWGRAAGDQIGIRVQTSDVTDPADIVVTAILFGAL